VWKFKLPRSIRFTSHKKVSKLLERVCIYLHLVYLVYLVYISYVYNYISLPNFGLIGLYLRSIRRFACEDIHYTIRLNAMRMFILEWSVWTLDLVGSGRRAPAPCTFRKYINTHLCIYMYEYVSVSMLPSNHQIAQNLRQWKRNYACSLRTGTRLRKHILCSYVCSLWAYMYIS